MASTTINPDTIIAIKANVNGATRRFSLPLRDLTITQLEPSIRSALGISQEKAVLLERFSDSAAAFIVLDAAHVPVYKQLYRAAKAKGKLRLRITYRSDNGPKPASVEDAVEPNLTAETVPLIPKMPEFPDASDLPALRAATDLPPPYVPETLVPSAEQITEQSAEEIASTTTERASEPEMKGESEPQSTNEAAPESADEPKPKSTSEQAPQQRSGLWPHNPPADGKPLDTVPAPVDISMIPDFIRDWRLRGYPNLVRRTDNDGFQLFDLYPVPAPSAAPAMTLFSHLMDSMPDKSTTGQPPTDVSQLSTFADTLWPTLMPECLKPLVNDPPTPRKTFTVCCNSCDGTITDHFWHCEICEDDDFDLCARCCDQGIRCFDHSHPLQKRVLKDSDIQKLCDALMPVFKDQPTQSQEPNESGSSVAKKCPASLRPSLGNLIELPCRPAHAVAQPPLASGPRSGEANSSALENTAPVSLDAVLPSVEPFEPEFHDTHLGPRRTCNSCLDEGYANTFVQCKVCADFDLCHRCCAMDMHGHNPAHEFESADEDTELPPCVNSLLAPGRNAAHEAICDGCDRSISGVRHKCLDCPDWDFCSTCIPMAPVLHRGHRFVPLYEPLPPRPRQPLKGLIRQIAMAPCHAGIYCDGPRCADSAPVYITGVRYKCAICNDVDFCATCEAHPDNVHNKTHPLIKFKTPVRAVNVTTTGEHEDGKSMPRMGDSRPQPPIRKECPAKKSPPKEEVSVARDIAPTPVQLVAEMKPSQYLTSQIDSPPPAPTKEIANVTPAAPANAELVAVYLRDTVADGTVLAPNETFVQTWVLRNEGTTAWPTGCSVKFVGGDYMGAVDPSRPASLRELAETNQSDECHKAVQPGEEQAFSVRMRTPQREGKVISYWRLTSQTGIKFGHKLWCDVTVETPVAPKSEIEDEEQAARSQMIIPKLEHESASSSLQLESPQTAAEPEEADVKTETDTVAPSSQGDFESFGDSLDAENWAELSEAEFMTDEEYEILDASDEEFFSEQQKQGRSV